jgi:hypothetical protein
MPGSQYAIGKSLDIPLAEGFTSATKRSGGLHPTGLLTLIVFMHATTWRAIQVLYGGTKDPGCGRVPANRNRRRTIHELVAPSSHNFGID